MRAWKLRNLARGGRKIADFLGMDVHTVSRGRRELFGGQARREEVRKDGSGRKRSGKIPEVIDRIADLLRKGTDGDPIHGLRCTRKTTKKIAHELQRLGIRVNAKTVGRLLKEMGFLLRVNHKNNESDSSTTSSANKNNLPRQETPSRPGRAGRERWCGRPIHLPSLG